jgi:DNA-binding beta-propeller fold protein YncE
MESAPEVVEDFSRPYGVAVDASGNVYASDPHNNRIQKFQQGTISVEPVTWTRLKTNYR